VTAMLPLPSRFILGAAAAARRPCPSTSQGCIRLAGHIKNLQTHTRPPSRLPISRFFLPSPFSRIRLPPCTRGRLKMRFSIASLRQPVPRSNITCVDSARSSPRL
jgi:hypothetical protein